jgi:hypothetical protein
MLFHDSGSVAERASPEKDTKVTDQGGRGSSLDDNDRDNAGAGRAGIEVCLNDLVHGELGALVPAEANGGRRPTLKKSHERDGNQVAIAACHRTQLHEAHGAADGGGEERGADKDTFASQGQRGEEQDEKEASHRSSAEFLVEVYTRNQGSGAGWRASKSVNSSSVRVQEV